MPSPSSAVVGRNDLGDSVMEFDLAANEGGFIASRVLPIFDAPRASGNFGIIPIEQLLQQRDVTRAPGSGYSRGNFTFEPATYTTQEYGAEEPVDENEAQNYADYFDAEMVAAARARSALLVAHEMRAADLLFNATTWNGASLTTGITNEWEVDGRLHVSGLVRNAKDAQRMYNYWTSQEAEMLALAPKAPFIGYGGQFEGYEMQWKTANTTNWPYLEVNPDATDGQGAVLPLPQRALPPMAQTGLIQAKMGAADDIKSTTGQYDASLGATSNERSGRAILAREKQGDTGTFHFVDNLARAVRYITRQIVDLAPKIYDTQRIARIIGIGLI